MNTLLAMSRAQNRRDTLAASAAASRRAREARLGRRAPGRPVRSAVAHTVGC